MLYYTVMNTTPFIRWIEKHNPQGLETLSVASKVPAVTIQKLLSDPERQPSAETAIKLAKVLEISLDELYGFKPEKDQTGSSNTP